MARPAGALALLGLHHVAGDEVVGADASQAGSWSAQTGWARGQRGR